MLVVYVILYVCYTKGLGLDDLEDGINIGYINVADSYFNFLDTIKCYDKD